MIDDEKKTQEGKIYEMARESENNADITILEPQYTVNNPQFELNHDKTLGKKKISKTKGWRLKRI